ncbi:MAG: hypothetical protein OXH75_15590 [Acidobacteria bacterium]|nr:hypothetical protein [Acidobacteriota bacterium]
MTIVHGVDIHPYASRHTLVHDLEQYGLGSTLRYFHSKGNGGSELETLCRRLLNEKQRPGRVACHHGPDCDASGLGCGPGPMATVPVPQAMFGCQVPDCAADVTYPAEMLTWWDGYTVEAFDDDDQPIKGCRDERLDPGWYCESCIEHHNAVAGESLRTYLGQILDQLSEDRETPQVRRILLGE